MPHVNQLVDEFGKKGLVWVGVTGEPEAPTLTYLKTTGMKGYVAFEPGLASMRKLGFDGFPSAVLVDPKGKIAWKGHPAGLNAKIIEDHIKGAKVGLAGDSPFSIDAELPKKYRAISKKLGKGELGRALTALDKALQSNRLTEADREKIKAARQAVTGVFEMKSAQAQSARRDGRAYDAYSTWKDIARAFKGHAMGRDAAQKAQEIKSDPTLIKELQAGERIARAIKFSTSGKKKRAVSVLKTVVSGPLQDTKEASRARKLLKEIEG